VTTGAEARKVLELYAALKRRSSTLLPAFSTAAKGGCLYVSI